MNMKTREHSGRRTERCDVARSRHDRRGNVLVLVAGILVLLVIVGFSYLSGTRTERRISVAQQQAVRSDDVAQSVRDMIAREIVIGLFPQPIDFDAHATLGLPFDPAAGIAENPNVPRLPVNPDAPRYGADVDYSGTGRPALWWNRAPYEVRPFTNWPDGIGLTPIDIPGNPGTNDTRWLSDFEPQRFYLTQGGGFEDGGASGDPTVPDIVEVFSHWTHLANPMRPGNGWMLVPFINNIAESVDSFITSSELGPYGTPVNQWLPRMVTGLNLDPNLPHGTFLPADFKQSILAGRLPKSYIDNALDFENRWINWITNYSNAVADFNSIPANLYYLDDLGWDLNGTGTNQRLEPGERPSDAFVGPGMRDSLGILWPDGTPRWNVERTFVDVTGDGVTDSLWWLAPVSAGDDYRTIVGIRVIDMSAMINVNAATQFARGRPQGDQRFRTFDRTAGHTPADIALMEAIRPGLPGLDLAYNSFLLHPENSEVSLVYTGNTAGFPLGTSDDVWRFFPDGAAGAGDPNSVWGALAVGFDPRYWQGSTTPPTVMLELGLDNDFLMSPLARLDYWRRSGLVPFNPIGPDTTSAVTPQVQYRPFTLADELALRAFGSANMPWHQARIERAFQGAVSNGQGYQFLRANAGREETNPYLDGLDVRPSDPSLLPPGGWPFDEILHDRRRMMTTISGARNETMPPWLWWENRFQNQFPNFTGSTGFQTFRVRSHLKLDLRELRDQRTPAQVQADAQEGVFLMQQRLPWMLVAALADSPIAVEPGTGNFIPMPDLRAYYGGLDGSNNDLYEDVVNEPEGPGTAAWQQTARMAAGLAANLRRYQIAMGNQFEGQFFGNVEDEVVPIPVLPGLDPLTLNPVLNTMGTTHTSRAMLGMDVQPFLVEVFFAYKYDPVTAQFYHPPFPSAPEVFPGNQVVHGDDGNGNDRGEVMVAIQIANPFDYPIRLVDDFDNNLYSLWLFEQEYPLYDAARVNPRTMILPGQAITYYANINAQFRDALDLELIDATRFDLEDVNAAGTVWSTTPDFYGSANGDRAVEITRSMVNEIAGVPTVVPVLLDRIDVHADRPPGVSTAWADQFSKYGETITDDLEDLRQVFRPGRPEPMSSPFEPPSPWFDVVVIAPNANESVVWLKYVRAAREWDRDLNNNGMLDDHERNPRFVFASHELTLPSDFTNASSAFSVAGPADEWFWDGTWTQPGDPDPRIMRFHPRDASGNFAMFNNFPADPDHVFALRDKNATFPRGSGTNQVINTNFSMQMLLKKGDIEQIGEIRNVFMYGHMLHFLPGTTQLDQSADHRGTVRTFAEFMIDGALSGMNRRVNRLQAMPHGVVDGERFNATNYLHSNVVGVQSSNSLLDPRSGEPNLPAGVRVFDALVCDGPGFNTDPTDPETLRLFSFWNAANFTGRMTPGMINISGAPREVMRAMPHWGRLVHETNVRPDGTTVIDHLPVVDSSGALNTQYEYGAGRVRIPEAVEAYRDRLGFLEAVPPAPPQGPLGFTDFRPAYGARGLREVDNPPASTPRDRRLNLSRGDRGFASIGEVALLNRSGRTELPGDPDAIAQWARAFSVDVVGSNHLASVADPSDRVQNRLSTDVQDVWVWDSTINDFVQLPDSVSGDAEEANLLFAGVSNMITTRSDVFGVWLRVRTVRRDPATGIWDGTNPDQIVDESRYFMIVDRSRVERVTDQPRILLFEKLPR